MAQRCHLPGRQAKAGLATLVQLRLVQHHSTPDGFTTYQAQIFRAYNLVRIGKLKSLAHRKLGKAAAVILEKLFELGFATVECLTEETLSELASRNAGEGRDANLLLQINEGLESLVSDGFVQQVRQAHLSIPHDARQSVDQDLKANPPANESKAKGKKLQEELMAFVDQEVGRRTESHLSLDVLRPHLMHANLTDNGVVFDSTGSQTEELYLAVNFSRAETSIRDNVITQRVHKTLGDGSSKLATAIMAQTGFLSTPRSGSPSSIALRTPEFDTINLTQLREDLTCKSSKRTNGFSQMNGFHHESEMVNGIDHDLTLDELDREDLHDGLSLIAEGRFPFLLHDEGMNTWKIDKVKLSIWLRDEEILKMISERTGTTGLRLIRMLIDRGKLDEKVMQELGLLNAKDLRQTLAELQQRGFVEIQEVPRDPQRTVARTIFLWFFDAERVQRTLLSDLYKAMARLYQRFQLEQEKVQTTLSKIERRDVRGNEEELLSSAELLALQHFRRKEMWLMGEIARLDDSVALLRDL